METTLIIAGAGMLIGAAFLSFAVERLIRRIGVNPARPEERSRGFGDVVLRLKEWSRNRQSSRDARK